MKIWVIYRDFGTGEFGTPAAAFTNEDDAIATATKWWGHRREWEITDLKLDEGKER